MILQILIGLCWFLSWPKELVDTLTKLVQKAAEDSTESNENTTIDGWQDTEYWIHPEIGIPSNEAYPFKNKINKSNTLNLKLWKKLTKSNMIVEIKQWHQLPLQMILYTCVWLESCPKWLQLTAKYEPIKSILI